MVPPATRDTATSPGPRPTRRSSGAPTRARRPSADEELLEAETPAIVSQLDDVAARAPHRGGAARGLRRASRTSARPSPSSARPARRATIRCTARRARRRARARPRRLLDHHRRRPRDHGGRQPRGARRRRAVDRARHRAPARAVREPLRRPGPQLPLLLHPQGDVRPLRERVRGLPGRVRDARRAVRGRDAAPDGEDPPLPDRPVRLVVLARAGRLAARHGGRARARSTRPTSTA